MGDTSTIEHTKPGTNHQLDEEDPLHPQNHFYKRLINAHRVVDELLKRRGLHGEDENKLLMQYEWVPFVQEGEEVVVEKEPKTLT